MARANILLHIVCCVTACSVAVYCFASPSPSSTHAHAGARLSKTKLQSAVASGNDVPALRGRQSLQHTYGGSLRGDDAALGQTKGTKNPLPQKSLLSRLTFTWVSNLMSLGNKRPLQMEDLWQLRPEQRMENMSETFAGYLQSAKSQTGPREEATAASPGNILREFWASPTTRATAHMFRRDFVVCGVLKFLNTLIQFTPSLLISRILKKLSAAPSKGLSASAVDMVTLPLLLLLSLSSKSVIENQYLDNTIQLGLKVKGSISSAIYRKSLQLSPAGKMNYTVGEIVNYLQIDTNRMEYVAGSVHVLWDSIFQVCGYMLLLMQFLGPSSLGGLAVMLVVIPINIHFQKRLSANKAAILKATDSRIGVTNEVLQGVRTIKSYNWEKPFAQQLQTQRELEIRALKKEANTRAILLAILSAAPSFVAMVTLSIYALLGHELTPAKVFTALALFNQLRYPVKILPIVVNKLSDGIVSLRRLDRFLAAEEVEQYVEAAPLHQDTGIEISDGTFTWSNEVGESEHVLTELPRGSLKDIQLQIKRGELVAVIGPVGSGKSTLITSMLGDLHKVCGRVALSGDVAYVPQASWIPNDSLRNVVTFGSEFKQDPYTEALRVCGLEKDLALLDNGDLTEIGERGVNLSGGQKQRLSLARAMYQDADIYLFDDPLSALDAEVGRAVFKDCIKGSLRSKTRVLVTHQLSVLPEVDRVVIMNVTESGVGYILDQGTFPELLQRGHNLKNLVQDVDAPTTDSLLVLSEQMASYNSTTATTYAYTGQVDKLTNISANATATINGSLYVHVDSDEPPLAAVYAGGDEGTRDTVSGDDVPVATYVPSSVAVAGTSDARQGERVDGEGAGGGKLAKKSGPVSLIVAEERADGAIKLGIYQRYYRAGGKPWLLALAAGALLTSNGSVLLQQWIVGAWTGDVGYVKRPLAAYLTGICMCAVLTATFTWLRTYLAFLFGTAASMSIHDAMTSQVLRAPLSYFESTPAGRLVQRFSKDLDCIDNNLPNSLQQFVAVCLNMAGALISMSFATPRFATVIGPLLAVYIATTNYYRNVARELKRIQSISRSPVYSHFGETLGGLNVIRSFRKQALYRRANEVKIDDSMSAYFALKAVDRWLSFRLEALGTAIVFFSALFAMMQTAEAGRAGIALSQALGITSLLNWAVRQGADVESLMNSVERVMYIIDKTPSEKYFMPDDPMHNAIGSGHIYDNSKLADDSVEDANGPAKSGPPSGDAALALAQSGWPWRGAISFSGVSMRYRHDMEPVLRGVTFDVLPGESIGIVGRTGSGKSSLFRALLRLTESEEGEVRIDGVDISAVGLGTLRSALSIIPQEPVFFSGSIARNIDPFGTRSEAELWTALRKAGMSAMVAALPGGLQFEVSENGDNFSAGQKQQLCLARALIRQSRILFLDEATSSVDSDTDALIQRTIRKEFGSGRCTTLTIAHRLESIADCDRILVMDAGRVVEFDAPAILLRDPHSLYSRLVHADRDREVSQGDRDVHADRDREVSKGDRDRPQGTSVPGAPPPAPSPSSPPPSQPLAGAPSESSNRGFADVR